MALAKVTDRVEPTERDDDLGRRTVETPADATGLEADAGRFVMNGACELRSEHRTPAAREGTK